MNELDLQENKAEFIKFIMKYKIKKNNIKY